MMWEHTIKSREGEKKEKWGERLMLREQQSRAAEQNGERRD